MNTKPETNAEEDRRGTTTDDREDETLMQALQRGDDGALAALMARWETGVKVFLLRLGVRPSDVEDVAQETFIRVYEKRASFRADAAFKPWLLTVAGNLGRNRLRWRFRRREESLDTANDAAGTEMSNSEAIDIGAHVRAAVDTLPDKLRHAVVCVEMEDLSYHEAAQAAGCTPKAIETRLYRARELLRRRLKGILAKEDQAV